MDRFDILLTLKDAIIKKHYDCTLSEKEATIYSIFVKEVYGSLDVDSVDESLLFNSYFDIYFNNYLDDNISLEKIEELKIFRGLLKYRGKTVSLEELYTYMFNDDTYDIKTEEGRCSFLERLNGCLGEARVAKVDTSGFEPRELTLDSSSLSFLSSVNNAHKDISLCDEIKITTSTNNNPLVFISGLEPNRIKEFKVEDNKKFTFVTISDLHLGKGLVDSLGILDDEGLKERLKCFVEFKNQLINDLKANGINIDSIILVGDTFDAFCGSFNDDDRESLLFNIDMSKKRLFSVIKNFNVLTGNDLSIGNDATFVGFIAGNHDNTLGRELFVDIMKEFGEDVSFLGDGSARIKINDEYILFSHPNSLDWGFPIKEDFYNIRHSLNRDMFHFDEYFSLCNRKYEFLSSLGLLHVLGTSPRVQIASLVDFVNEDLKNNNPELYEFYKPFITRGNGNGNANRKSCFEDAIRIDDSDPSSPKLVKHGKTKHSFGIDRFIDYGKSNMNIKSMLDDSHVCLTGDYLKPTLSIIGHFHTRLSGGKKFTYAREDNTSSNDGVLPVVVEEGSTFSSGPNELTFSATVCSLDIKDGVIDRIELEPAVYVVGKNNDKYQATRMIGTTSSVYVRKKTL